MQLYQHLICLVSEVCWLLFANRMPYSTRAASVGPSSSHTVGPMRAGKIFINDLLELGVLEKVLRNPIASLACLDDGCRSIQSRLPCASIEFVPRRICRLIQQQRYGSLAATGKGYVWTMLYSSFVDIFEK